MDSAISQQQQDLVCLHLDCRLDTLQEFGKKRSEKGRAAEADLGECLFVHLNNTLNTDDFRIGCVAVHCETVTDTINTKMTRYTAKSKHREASVGVIGLYYISHIPERALILVVLTEVVKRAC